MTRTSDGKFIKGVSGNPKGRGKKEELIPTTKAENLETAREEFSITLEKYLSNNSLLKDFLISQAKLCVIQDDFIKLMKLIPKDAEALQDKEENIKFVFETVCKDCKKIINTATKK